MNALLALFGMVLVAVGAGLIYLPAGLIVFGAGLVAVAYVKRYMEAHSEDSRASRS